MKRTVKISGVIVGVLYDDDWWFGSAIRSGRITPCSRFRRALDEAAAAGDEVEVYVNSYGGDVFAGNDMIAAFQAFQGRKSVVVGGLAASMAANFVLQCGAPVTVHANSTLLFHSATNETDGGAAAHRDSATLIDQVNAPVAKALKAKGVPAKLVDEAFSEGRQLTITGEDAKRYGIADTIVGGEAEKPEPISAAATFAAMAELPKLAAQAAQLIHTAMENTPAPAGAAAQPAAPAPEPTAPAAAADPAPAAPVGETHAPAPTAAAPTAPAAAADPAPAPTAPAPAAPAADVVPRAELDKANGRISELEAQLKETQTLLQQSKAQHAALAGHVMTDSAAPGSWPDAIKACGGDVGKALRSFPALAKEFRAAYGAKQPTV